jgi:Domain of unknown function (DUF4129)
MPEERTPSPPRRGPARSWSRGRALGLALAGVALLALVSVGSLRDPPGAGRGTPRFPSALVETLGLLGMVALLAGVVIGAWTLLPGRREVVRRPRNPLVGPLVLLLTVFVLSLLNAMGWLDLLRLPGLRPPETLTSQPTVSTVPRTLPRSGPRWLSFVVVGALLLALAAAIVVRSALARRRLAARAQPRELAQVLDHTIDQLEDEADPRRAVIAAWIRMERGMAAVGLPRRAAEAPFEYVARVLQRAGVDAEPVRRLADLFEQAKFSRHAIDEAMRRSAVEALTTIREQLEVEQARLEAMAGSREGEAAG